MLLANNDCVIVGSSELLETLETIFVGAQFTSIDKIKGTLVDMSKLAKYSSKYLLTTMQNKWLVWFLLLFWFLYLFVHQWMQMMTMHILNFILWFENKLLVLLKCIHWWIQIMHTLMTKHRWIFINLHNFKCTYYR